MTMLLGIECDNSHFRTKQAYEILLLLNITTDYTQYTSNPFYMIDRDYYHELITLNPLLLKELIMIKRFTQNIKTKNTNSMEMQLLNLKNENYITSFHSFIKLIEIIRTGWIKRNVNKKCLESDADHIMQMMAFASAYFTLFPSEDLDDQKVMEMMLIHESGEILAGDIAEGDILHSTKNKIEEIGVRNLFCNFKKGEYFINMWKEFEKRESKEANFVYELDKLDPVMKAKCLDEILERNDLLLDFYKYEDQRDTFKKSRLKNIFQSLQEI